MNYIFIILAFVISVCIALFVIPRILLISLRKRLFDIPDKRKIHTCAIPRLGGVSFFPTILFSCCLVLAFRTITGYYISDLHATCFLLALFCLLFLLRFLCFLLECLFLVCGLTLLYLTGITDDLIGVRYRQKFVIQILCACFFSIAELWINDLYGLLGIYAIPNWIGIPFTILTIVFITNAINLIDGIDGLASGLSSVALLVFGLLFIEKGLWMYSMLAFSTLGVLVPFFYYNVFGNAERARKIFMGDTGSLTLGYILSFLAIKYSQNNPEVISNTKGTFLIAFSTLIIPAFDVVMVRLRNGKSPFEPDKNHIHHKFLAMGFTPRKAMIIIILISCAFSVVNILLIPWVNNTVILIGDIVAWIALNLWWDKVRDKRTHLNRLY